MTTDLLETIAQVLLEELQVPDDYQLVRSNSTTIHLSQPHPHPYFYIGVEPDHILVVEWSREDRHVPYANPQLVEQIQQIIDDHIARTARMEADK